MAFRVRPSSSIFPGQGYRLVHRLPKKSSRIWASGYKIGYMNSVLASLELCNMRTPMARHSNYELNVEGATEDLVLIYFVMTRLTEA